jgi:hypothetical protein
MKKAGLEQAFLKLGMYGMQSSGKTFTALLIGEWLLEQDAKKTGQPKKRMAFIDTEHGTDFYAIDVKDRKVHPEAFDFDRAITRSISEVKDFLIDHANPKRAEPSEFGVILIDSVTHIWEAAKEAYSGALTSAGTYPKHAWGPIKKPWKAMMEAGLNGNFHFIFCGREGLIFEKDEEKGEEAMTGYKMKAEGEAPYEPHVLVQMYQYRNLQTETSTIKAFFEKDRSGAMFGKTVAWPTGETFLPIYSLLGIEQGSVGISEKTAEQDAKAEQDEKDAKNKESVVTFETIRAGIIGANDLGELKAAWELTKGKKRVLGPDRFDALDALVDGRKLELKQKGAA